MGVRGTSREDVLRQRIKELLPQKFTVGNGIITDCQGKQSRQQDFSFMMLLIHLHFYKRSPLVLFLWKVYMQP